MDSREESISSRKRSLALTPVRRKDSDKFGDVSGDNKKRIVTDSSARDSESIDWHKQYIIQSKELQRVSHLKKFLEMEKQIKG